MLCYHKHPTWLLNGSKTLDDVGSAASNIGLSVADHPAICLGAGGGVVVNRRTREAQGNPTPAAPQAFAFLPLNQSPMVSLAPDVAVPQTRHVDPGCDALAFITSSVCPF